MAEGSKTACDPVLFLSLCAPGWRQPWIFSGRMKAARRGAGWPDNATPSWVCCRIAVSRWSLTDQRGNGDTPGNANLRFDDYNAQDILGMVQPLPTDSQQATVPIGHPDAPDELKDKFSTTNRQERMPNTGGVH